ncbi:MAG: Holliday junction branch migration protein RuvA [Deltaproteobacteria bacterium]|nr:Holliday junction branch migration protein RuvA [Deltaproteobacteria bacterium]
MIAFLKGILLFKAPNRVVIDNNGIGYEVFLPLSTFYALPDLQEKVSLHIHTHVREDAIVLFGFQTMLEKQIFTLLIAVTGIGPKLAVNILSGIGPEELLQAMTQGNAARMQSIPGVGKKTAERIALELREKALKVLREEAPLPAIKMPPDEKTVYEDALSALVNLGYSAKSARDCVEKARSRLKEPSLEAWIREALRLLN